MRTEWGSDGSARFAAQHRAEYFAALDRIRAVLDAFAPDAVIVFGDDQYECFKEDLVPPYCVFMSKISSIKPCLRARAVGGERANIWNDPRDARLDLSRRARNRRDLAWRFNGVGLRSKLPFQTAPSGFSRPRLCQHTPLSRSPPHRLRHPVDPLCD